MKKILAASAVVLAAIQPAAAHKAENLKLAAIDKDGAVLLETPELPDRYHLYLRRVEPDGTFSGFSLIYVEGSMQLTPTGFAPTGRKKLSALRLKPGRYAINHAVQSYNWDACLWRGTLAFDVKPGVATYIGDVDPRPTLEDLVAQAKAAGVEVSRNVNRFKDGIVSLTWTAPTEERMTEIDRDRARLFKSLTAPIERQEPVAFKLPSRKEAGPFCNW